MSESLLSSKRVAKNTFFLYLRMLIIMLVSLYTSRVLLEALGIEDFGIYNLVAGFIVLFNFLQSAFTSSTTRFIGVAITKENAKEHVSIAYSSAFFLHLCLAFVFIIGLETIGLWYVNNYMNIPSGREPAVYVVLQLSMVNALFLIMRVPENALVIAYERMNFFAVIGIIESVFKLGIVFLVLYSSVDHLILYSLFVVLTNAFVTFLYFYYTHYKLPVKPFFQSPQKKVLRGMFSFIGWNSLGGFSNIGYQQGLSLLLNLFYGVGLNAAMGIANQVKGAVYSLVSNIRAAADPQIIKSYSLAEYNYCGVLMGRVTRISHYLLLFLAIPVMINIKYILNIWLKNPPEYAYSFVILMLIYSMLDGLMGPLWIVNQATGNIRNYQLIRSVFYLSIIPITYIAMKWYSIPEIVVIISIVFTLILYIIQIPTCIRPLGMKMKDYYKEILLPVIIASIIPTTITYLSEPFFKDGLCTLIGTTLVNTLVLAIVVLTFGIRHDERSLVFRYINERINKYRYFV